MDSDKNEITVGFAITGSYCTFNRIIPQIRKMVELGYNVVPIVSERTVSTDTRFGTATSYLRDIEGITGSKAILTIADAEPIGPKKILDVLIVAPCTGNTIAKLANGIADTSVTLAVKSHLRNKRPVVIAVSTNDGLGANARNIGILLARKHIYMVPFGQDDCVEKENSLVADFELIAPTVEYALDEKQIQPLLLRK